MVSDLNFTIGLTESKYKRSYDVAKAAVQQDEDKVLEIIEKTLDDNKAEDVVVIDLRGKTSIANQWWLPAVHRSVMSLLWRRKFRKI